jgi:hypothetical protein
MVSHALLAGLDVQALMDCAKDDTIEDDLSSQGSVEEEEEEMEELQKEVAVTMLYKRTGEQLLATRLQEEREFRATMLEAKSALERMLDLMENMSLSELKRERKATSVLSAMVHRQADKYASKPPVLLQGGKPMAFQKQATNFGQPMIAPSVSSEEDAMPHKKLKADVPVADPTPALCKEKRKKKHEAFVPFAGPTESFENFANKFNLNSTLISAVANAKLVFKNSGFPLLRAQLSVNTMNRSRVVFFELFNAQFSNLLPPFPRATWWKNALSA